MEVVTFSVEFNLNDIMHRQIDVAAIRSPLGPAFANTFVCCYESIFQAGDVLPLYR